MDKDLIIEAANILTELNEGISIPFPYNNKTFNQISKGAPINKMEQISIYLRTRYEASYSHGPSIKVGHSERDFAPITFPGCEIINTDSFGSKQNEKAAINAARCFVMDNVMLLVALWNSSDAEVVEALRSVAKRKIAENQYYKSIITVRKSSKEEAKDREELTKEVRAVLNDSSIILDFELADKFNEKKKLKKQMKKKRRG